MTIKPMRAENWDPTKIKFPVWAEPKLDGVRGYNPHGTLLARTLKQHRNRYTTDFYSKPEYIGFDGELAAERETHPALCRITSSAVSTLEGTPYTLWHIFDYVTEETRRYPYCERYAIARDRIKLLQSQGMCGHLRIVPYKVANNLEELMAIHQEYVDAGYEGTCFYGPDVTHKEGKSSPRHNGVLRIKDFIEEEAIVLSITEGETNLNEAQTNELGRTFRSSHQENKIPNGMVGNLQCRLLKDVVYCNETILTEGQLITVAPGTMTDVEKRAYYVNPKLIVGQIIKFKFFPKGIKDKPRFPQFQAIRSKEDM
jgi:DNA ligase 1